jgi:UDP-N-acetylglucosamine 1-carboxyvinyltransferase
MSRQRFEIEGGNPISGVVHASGNKNAALPLLCACLLTDEELILRNVPAIGDVGHLLEILADLGVKVEKKEAGVISLNASGVNGKQPNPEIAKQIRASILLAGPLLAQRGNVELPPPGGDVIGRRRIDTHVLGLTGLGASFEATRNSFQFRVQGKLQGAELFLDEASVTATENIVMAASLAQGRTVIMNAASEPHIQDLCHLLNAMGANISGIGTNRLIITGADKLNGTDFTLGPDYIEVGSLIVLAAVTGGALTIKNSRPHEHRATRIAFGRLGIDFHGSEDGKDIIVPGGQDLAVRSDLLGAIPKIEDAIWPGFPADLTSIAVVGATQSEGTVVIHEKLFESRLFFTDRLSAMGARIILCDPHRVVITGKAHLYAQELVSPDIRAGMALVIAALCADGTSTIHNVHQIDRGYERIDERLNALGANIKRIID